MSELVRPMMAVLRHGLPADDDAYGWELKWDGVRAVAYVRDGGVTLMSRNDKDMSRSYPELAALGGMLGEPVILDGEIVALRDGRPDFGLLQSRMHVQRPSDRLVTAAPVLYYVFDLLRRGEESLLGEPYPKRRAALEELGLSSDPVHTPPWWRGGGPAVLAASIDQGLEGVVGKPLTSRYLPGRRGPWIKVKNVRHQEVIVAGWTPGEGRRADMIGSLVLGVYDDHGLRYVGNVGTGFTDAILRDLAATLAPLRRDGNPFDTTVPAPVARTAHWVEPDLVGEVAFAEWTGDGHLRHPSWRGLRPDKEPEQVHAAED
ncbi:non-homologous end-joining DNA ligase [Actinomadura sp. DC4]|uniref:non-homologous end-joining DNA ligase n=1 Tax=Actinomadura sp. DC4 TaxID=3055069 RepID=UPI0025B1170F|nr:non-homologous end-joining DNA ligase [Actinomadura sp. DC4]MDN3359826.1 non-homologous end-joining DNA ligase [Actinomadura sp. DC4]